MTKRVLEGGSPVSLGLRLVFESTVVLMQRFANPAVFRRLSRRIMPVAAVIAALAGAVGLYLALVASPADYQQGETVRIMYVHVPAAWMAMGVYSSMAIAAIVGFIWRHPLADLYTKAVAPIGAVFTALCLITGSIWGAPMWGTWWVWDARLTSVLILFFLYLGYLALVNAFDEPERGLQAGAILVIVGAVNLPIIKFSVDWWNTLHQPASVTRLDSPAMGADMLYPLLTLAVAYAALFTVMALWRVEGELLVRKVRAAHYRRTAPARASRPVAAEH